LNTIPITTCRRYLRHNHHTQSDCERGFSLSGRTKRYRVDDYIGIQHPIEKNERICSTTIMKNDEDDRTTMKICDESSNNKVENETESSSSTTTLIIEKLRKELEEANQNVKRWETVNNKLIQKLNRAKSVAT